MFTHSCKHINVVMGALLAMVSSGCATNARVTRIENDVRDIQRTADFALAEAKEARERAKNADERALRAEEMVNRSFHHAMRK